MRFVLMKGSGLRFRASSPEGLLENRRNILFSRFSFFAFVVVLAHTIQDSFQGLITGAVIDAAIAGVILTAYILNERGHHLAGKTLLLMFVNCSLAIYCSLVPKHNGVFLHYFPLIGLSSVVFDAQHRIRGLFFLGLSTAFLVALVFTDFKLLGDVSIAASPETNSFLINLTSSVLILILCIRFIVKCNEESEKRLTRLADEISQKNSNLEKTNAELDRFVYSASHDLRAPLLSIQGVVNIARLETMTPGMGHYLGLIHSQMVKLDSFIKDIVSFSRNERTDISLQKVNLNHVLDEVREDLKFMDGAEHIRWEKELEFDDWTLDKCRIITVFNNLISNAIKYQNKHQEDPWIKVGVKQESANCCITIRDNGLGIPHEHQKRVFDMFYRAHDHSTGSGLGLYIVKEVIRKMKGQIRLESEPGRGSVFTIILPPATV